MTFFLLIDHFGLFGLTEARISSSRALGIGLVFLGAYITHNGKLS